MSPSETETIGSPGEFSDKPPWRPRVSGIVGFIFGPVGAAIITFISFRRLGERRKANLTLGLTILGVALWFLGIALLPALGRKFVGQFIGQIISPFLYPAIQSRSFKEWKASHPEVETYNWWKATGWGVIGLVSFFAIAVIVEIPFLTTEKVENINVHVTVPTIVANGEQFAFDVAIENTAANSQSLSSIGFPPSLSENIPIQMSQPPFKDSEAGTLSLGRSYVFEKIIPPKSTLSVEFHALSKSSGVFSSDIRVCINSTTNCEDFPIQIAVHEPH